MVFLSNNEDLSAASGILNVAFLEAVYHSVMDDTYGSMGIARPVVLHLKPEIEQDPVTQAQPAPQQYNPFFGRTPVPKINTRSPGVKITPRDVQYTAQIRVGPIEGDDEMGIGNLKANEAVITLVVESLPHLRDTLSISIEGRRYSIDETRPIGFSRRRYVMVFLTEINETEPPSPDITIG
jgi:hypothetical protein